MNGTPKDKLAGVKETHGVLMVELVKHAGMSREAVEVLGGMLRQAEGQIAIRILAEAFNWLSTELSKEKGWTAEMLDACEKDILQVYAREIAEAKRPSIIVH